MSMNKLLTSGQASKLHSKIANVRSDFLHKLTSTLTRHYGVFGVENFIGIYRFVGTVYDEQ